MAETKININQIKTYTQNISSTTPELSLEDNTYYTFTNSLTSLTISSIPVNNEHGIDIFFSTANGFTGVTFPQGTLYTHTIPTWEAGKTYLISIQRNIVVVAEISATQEENYVVTSVNSKSGNVVLTGEDINIDSNTSTTINTAVNNKQDKPNIQTLTTDSTELVSNTIYNGGELASVTITLPNTVPVDFIVQLEFSSGTTATTFTAPASLYFNGDACENGVFTPTTSKRYCMMIINDGINVQGFVAEK